MKEISIDDAKIYTAQILNSTTLSKIIYNGILKEFCKDCLISATCTKNVRDNSICDAAYDKVFEYAVKVLNEGLTL